MTGGHVLQAKQLRAAILLVLDEQHRLQPYRIVTDTEIAEQLGAPIEDIRRQLDILEAEGYTKSANSSDGHRAWIAAKGMAVAEELREAPEGKESPGRPIGFD